MKYKTIPFIWENPEIQGINRLPMRPPLMPFPSPQEALLDAIAGPEFRNDGANPFYMTLDGIWRFKLLDNPLDDLKSNGDAESVPEWVSPSFDAADWADITVPGTWTRQGWDKPHYTNVQMPFQGAPPHTPAHNPTGLYQRNFRLPEEWNKRRIVLHIGSAESCCLVYVNGIFAGAGKDTRLPSEYDITPFLSEQAEQRICLKIVRYSDASYIEDQDQWWFGGPHRSIYLYTTEDCYIKDVQALPGTVFTDAGVSRGRIALSVTLGGRLPESISYGDFSVKNSGSEPPFTIAYRLYPFILPASKDDVSHFKTKTPPLLEGEIVFEPDYRRNSNRAETALILDNPELWSSETPNLYVLGISLMREGRHIESAALLTGFRNVGIAERELRINNRAVLIKGVNRHEHDEKTGKTLSTEAMVRDIKLLKTHNFNAVRTSHYPNDERWYDLCDRYGIYLADEANIEHHCFYNQLCGETDWTYPYTSRIQRMVERDKNHLSIIIWSLGNESGDGPHHAMMSAWIHRFDPSRPVNSEGAVHPEGGGGFTLDSLCRGRGVTDIISPMYPAITLIKDFVTYRKDDRPLIMIEYSHAMGNSNGSLADYWEAIETHQGLQGGFIWDWIDQGLEAFSPEGTKYWQYGGDFGDTPSDYDFCLNGLLFPDQTPKPAMAECKQVFAPIRLTPLPSEWRCFSLENRFDFSTLEGIELCWELRSETEVLAQGTESLPALGPGAKAEIRLPVPESIGLQNYSETVYIHIDFRLKKSTPWTEAGFVICSAERVLREPSRELAPAAKGAAPELSAFAALFKPSLFRVPTENDGLKLYTHLRGDPAAVFYYRDKPMYPWLDLDLLHLRLGEARTDQIIWFGYAAQRYQAVLSAGEAAAADYKNQRLGTYTCITAVPENSNTLILDITFDLDPSLPELPKAGVAAKIPGYYRHIVWFGAGPHESYPDRKAAAFLGRWEDTPESLETPYIVPQENGNRSGVRSVTLSALPGTSVPAGKPGSVTIRMEKPLNMSVSRYTQENMLAAGHTVDLKDQLTGPDGYYLLNLDAAQRGVGTGTCGPDTLEAYRIRPGLFTMRLYITVE